MIETIKLDEGHHKFERFAQRMHSKEWAKLMLEHRDTVVFEGRVRKLRAKKMGYGIVEISKVPLDFKP